MRRPETGTGKGLVFDDLKQAQAKGWGGLCATSRNGHRQGGLVFDDLKQAQAKEWGACVILCATSQTGQGQGTYVFCTPTG